MYLVSKNSQTISLIFKQQKEKKYIIQLCCKDFNAPLNRYSDILIKKVYLYYSAHSDQNSISILVVWGSQCCYKDPIGLHF